MTVINKNKNVSCAQVENIDASISQYESQGFTVRSRARPGCAFLDRGDTSVYICEMPKEQPVASISPHDELDEAADAFWLEEPC